MASRVVDIFIAKFMIQFYGHYSSALPSMYSLFVNSRIDVLVPMCVRACIGDFVSMLFFRFFGLNFWMNWCCPMCAIKIMALGKKIRA